jgi:hypothetical protein
VFRTLTSKIATDAIVILSLPPLVATTVLDGGPPLRGGVIREGRPSVPSGLAALKVRCDPTVGRRKRSVHTRLRRARPDRTNVAPIPPRPLGEGWSETGVREDSTANTEPKGGVHSRQTNLNNISEAVIITTA